ncbi:TIR domain-containing protein [Bradyrhizobium sp. th.b2]|uniref:TIR domain-containing protein n=1 Tax=Bradyrhizobium sp. th-b2 TaxID=172088 RepID=UPI00048D6C92|nr:TIR domain-containing protein [Bradyrhizobium sp. th.b2]
MPLDVRRWPITVNAGVRNFFARLRTWISLRRLTDTVFGYDFFISYKQDDGRQYPRQLAAALSKEGFKVFLDESGFSAGDDLLLNTRRRVRMSPYLLVIGRPGALTRSDWVVREVEQCLAADNIPIVIDIDNCFLKVQASSAEETLRLSTLRRLLAGRLRLLETTGTAAETIFDGMPSEHILREVKRSFAGRRQDSRRARAFGVATAVFGVLALVAAGLAVAAVVAQQQAEREARRSRVGELAAQSRLIRERQPQLANLLASEAVEVVLRLGEPVPATGRQALVEAVVGSSGEGIAGNGAELGALDISPDGRWWAIGGDDGSLQLLEMKADGGLAPVVTLPRVGKLNVRYAGFDATSSWLVTAGDGGDACLWSLADPAKMRCLALAPTETLYDVRVSPDRRRVAAVTLTNKVLLWDLSRPDPAVGVGIGDGFASARYVHFSGDGNWLVVRGIEHPDFWFWDLGASPAQPEAYAMHGHPAGVAGVATDTSHARLASIDEQGRVYIWQRNDKIWKSVEWMAASQVRLVINDLAFSPDGGWLAAATAPGLPQDEAGSTLHLWQLSPQGALVQSKKFRLDGQIRGLDFAPADRRLYVEGLEGKLWVLDLADGLAAGPVPLPGHADTVTRHAFSPDGRYLVTGDNGRAVMLWDFTCKLSPPAPITLTGHEAAIRTLQFSPDARWLVSSSDDATARRWDMSRALPGDALTLARACQSDMAAAQSSDDHVWFAGGTEDGSVRLHHLATADPSAVVRQLQNQDRSAIEDLRFDPTGKWLVAANKSQTLDVWDLTARSIENSRRHLVRLQRGPDSIGFTPDGRQLITRASGGTALMLDLTQVDPDATATVLAIPGHEIDDVVLSKDGRWLAAKAYDFMFVWDLSRPREAPIKLPVFDSFIETVRISADSRRLIVIDHSGNLRSWPLPVDDPNSWLGFSVADRQSDIVFSRDDQWMAVTTTVDPHLKVFRMTDRPVPLPVVPKGSAEANGRIALSHDSLWLAYAADKALLLWKTSQLDRPPIVIAAPSRIERLIFSEDTRWLAFGSDRGDVAVVEITQQGPLNPFSLRPHRGAITFLYFGPQGRSLISQSYNRLRLTPLEMPALLKLADERTGRNFSALEWDSYFYPTPYRKAFARLPGVAER